MWYIPYVPFLMENTMFSRFDLWMSRGNSGWVMASIGFIIIMYLVLTED